MWELEIKFKFQKDVWLPEKIGQNNSYFQAKRQILKDLQPIKQFKLVNN